MYSAKLFCCNVPTIVLCLFILYFQPSSLNNSKTYSMQVSIIRNLCFSLNWFPIRVCYSLSFSNVTYMFQNRNMYSSRKITIKIEKKKASLWFVVLVGLQRPKWTYTNGLQELCIQLSILTLWYLHSLQWW